MNGIKHDEQLGNDIFDVLFGSELVKFHVSLISEVGAAALEKMGVVLAVVSLQALTQLGKKLGFADFVQF